MAKILLTSCGFETETIKSAFIDLIENAPEKAKVLFIPTAATYVDAIMVLPKCMNDLLGVGIPKANISVYNMHEPLSVQDILNFDALYFTGGDPQYLLDRMNKLGFSETVKEYMLNGGVYVGVSAGSLIAANNMADNLGLVNCTLAVHVSDEASTRTGALSGNDVVMLSSKNAVLINDDRKEIIR